MKLNLKRHVNDTIVFVKTHIKRLAFIASVLVSLALILIFHGSPVLIMIGTVELVLIAIVVNSFVFLYLSRNWKANPYGRALMYSKISLALLVNLSLVTVVLGPDWPWRGTVRILLFGIILFSQARLLQLLFSLRNHEARAQYDDNHDSEGREI